MGSRHHRSRSRHGGRDGRRRDHGSSGKRRSWHLNPLTICGCTWGGPRWQTVLLFALPLFICAILFLAGVWTMPVFRYVEGGNTYVIAAQGYKTNGNDNGSHKFMYSNSWPDPMSGLPLLLMCHLIAAVLLLAYLLVMAGLAVRAAHNRNDDVLKRDVWSETTRRPAWYSRLLTVLLTLAVGTLLSLDNAVWGVAQKKKYDLKPEVLGYFVCIVAFLLWFAWVAVQLAATQDRKYYYTEGGKMVYIK